MRSHARLTYTRVAGALGGAADADMRPLLDDLRVAHELAKKLTRSAASAAASTSTCRKPRSSSTRRAMWRRSSAARATTRTAWWRSSCSPPTRGWRASSRSAALPTVYRIHDQPDQEKLDAFAALARTHGFELPGGDELTPGVLNEFLKAVEGKPAQKALNSLLLRAMMQAQYSPDNIGHYGLAAPTYLHFTSPIRRYPDLMVHRAAQGALGARRPAAARARAGGAGGVPRRRLRAMFGPRARRHEGRARRRQLLFGALHAGQGGPEVQGGGLRRGGLRPLLRAGRGVRGRV